MDFELQDLLAEMDTKETWGTFENMDPDQVLDQMPEESKVGQLVKKMVDRQKKQEEEAQALQTIYSDHKQQVQDDLNAYAEYQNLGEELNEMFGNPENERKVNKPEHQQDIYEKMKELKVDRQRVKAEIEVIKEVKLK